MTRRYVVALTVYSPYRSADETDDAFERLQETDVSHSLGNDGEMPSFEVDRILGWNEFVVDDMDEVT